jgi:hypothetical protein
MTKPQLPSDMSGTTRRIAWIVLLTLASLAFSYVFACAAPFVALATLAALNVQRRDAYVLTVLVWLANQAVGYGLLNYPRTPDSFAWGIAIGIAALLATRTVVALGPRPWQTGPVFGPALGFVGAFAAYELALYAASLVLGGSETAFTLSIVWYVLKVNVMALAGLVVLSLGAGAIGLTQPVPTVAGRS